MDTHSPSDPFRSIADFGLHILTVTIGILIALGLDALVQIHRDGVLADHARADFRAELLHNQASLVADQPRIVAMKTELEGWIQYGQDRLAKKPTQPLKLSPFRTIVKVPSAAWETALATQALLHLPFAEARAISGTYSRQTVFNDLEDRAEAQWFNLAAFGDPESLDEADTRQALQQVMMAYAYLASIEKAEQALLDLYATALSSLPPA